MVQLKNPLAPASKKQLYKLYELTGKDTRELKLNMQQASDKIEDMELQQIADNNKFEIPEGSTPFTEAHVTIIEGPQRGGKTATAVGKVKDAYFIDCVLNYCKDVLGIKCKVKAYYNTERVAKIKHEGKVVYIRIPPEHKLHSDLRIFSNIHLFGLPFVFIPSFRHALKWLQQDIIRDGWLILDEAHFGINARAGMTSLGQELEKQSFQYGKMQLDVIIITHMARLIDWAIRTIPTERISCTYNEKTRKVTYTIRKKGQQGTREVTYDATQYFPNFWTNEKVNA